jgi:hypothetical protein
MIEGMQQDAINVAKIIISYNIEKYIDYYIKKNFIEKNKLDII